MVTPMSVFHLVGREQWLASNDLAFAISDQFAVSPGHALIVPHRQFATWWEATRAEQIAILELVDEVKALLDRSHKPDGYNVGFNAGEAAGQTIHQLHLHVIPRYTGDLPDPRGGIRNVFPDKGNYLATPRQSEALITPTSGGLHRELRKHFSDENIDRIDLIISFVMRSGVQMLGRLIDEALDRGAAIRLLTTDYMDVTDPAALGFFMDRVGTRDSGGFLEVRVFSDPSVSFHPKGYIFRSSTTDAAVAFVGSSNMSASGLRAGVEWNLRSGAVTPMIEEFERMWADHRSAPITADWLKAYDERKQFAQRFPQPVSGEGPATGEHHEEPIKPWSVQQEAIAALQSTRIEGHRAGLVVMATGLGKTWLAAFDSTNPAFRRVLFVAHRDEILATSRDVFRKVRPGSRLTMFTGGTKQPDGDVVFAGVQALQRNLDQFSSEAFDYIVVDEFHHAAARTYRRVLSHFRPKFMLGLTATPDRTDAADLLALCDDNLVYDCGLVDGLRRDLLSPFHYRAIKDVADYEEIPWRSGRFVIDELSEQLETQQRAQQVLDEWLALDGPNRRALAFCCSVNHANFMAGYFRDRGVAAEAVHTGEGTADRGDALDRLEEREINVLFCVDLFNEGVDVPALDMVLLLRPTESAIVFFQQLGRGLRKSAGKTHLDVIDLVGNHRSFFTKFRLLASLANGYRGTDRAAIETFADGPVELPHGCSIVVETEAIDLMRSLLGAPRKDDRLADAISDWRDEHDGQRPTALQMSMLTGQAHDLKKSGGWFGFLDSLGLLTDDERAVLGFAGDFLIDVEHGAYTKSYKLVTLKSMLDMGSLRTGTPLRDIYVNTRWQMLRDPRLLADLADTTTDFANVLEPTGSEWPAYWRKNPIAALTGANRSTPTWFALGDDSMQFHLAVPDALGATFDEMASEIVEYRLHRYLVTRDAKRKGQRLQPTSGGRLIDAAFVVEEMLGQPVSILFESAGGAGPDGIKRNPEYVAGIDAVLERLKALGVVVLDAYVDSSVTRSMPIPDRRLDAGGTAYPIDLGSVEDVAAIRKSLLKSMASIGREKTAKEGGGNSRKAMRLILGGVDGVDAISLGRALSSDQPHSSGAEVGSAN